MKTFRKNNSPFLVLSSRLSASLIYAHRCHNPAMANQLIRPLANVHREIHTMSKIENEWRVSKRLSSSKALPIKQPKLLPNPALRQVRRRPAQLNLSRSIAAPGASPPTSATTKPPKIVSVRDKLLHGISMDLGRLQQNPAAFDRIFPPQRDATATKSSWKRARLSTEKLLDQLHDTGSADLEHEEEEARQFERKMRSVCV